MPKTRNHSWQIKQNKKLDNIQNALSQTINKAQMQGEQTLMVTLDQHEIIELIENRLKQADIPIDFFETGNKRLYYLRAEAVDTSELDRIAAAADDRELTDILNKMLQ